MLNEEVARYEQLTGESAENVSVSLIGAYLDGVDKGIEELEKVKVEVTDWYMQKFNTSENVIDILDRHISELKGEQNE